jgi:hypothetical protein
LSRRNTFDQSGELHRREKAQAASTDGAAGSARSGLGWKVSLCIIIEPGGTFTLVGNQQI